MTVINTNISALIANNAISQNDRAMSSSMEKLATGSRINSAKDDAAGLAMSSRMASQIGGLEMGVRNVNDAISLLKTADAATKEITNMLGRMRELAVQASSDTYTTNDRAALDQEYQALLLEIDRIAETTEWNGVNILAGGSRIMSHVYESQVHADYTFGLNNDDFTLSGDSQSLAIQAGVQADQSLSLEFKCWRPEAAVDGSMTAADGTDKSGVDRFLGERQLVHFNDTQTLDAHGGGTPDYMSLMLAGLTVTVTNNDASNNLVITDNTWAKLWEGLTAGATEGNYVDINPGGHANWTVTWSGKLTDWVTGYPVNDVVGGKDSVYFYSVGTPGDNYANPMSDTLPHTEVNGGPVLSHYRRESNTPLTPYTDVDDPLTPYSEQKDSQSAYGAGLLYFGGNRFTATPKEPTALNLTSQANASQVILELSAVLDGASAERAKYGAYLNRLQHAADNLTNISINTSTSLSRIADTDYAEETTELARSQIITQASTAMLAQANQSKQTVLALLR